MNILEEIQNCPVEWKELWEVCDTVTDFTAAGSFASNAKNVKYIQEASFAQLVRTTDLKSGFKGNNFVYVDEHAFNYLYRVNLDQESLVMPNVGNCGEIYYIEPENLPYENNVLGPNALLVRSSKENNRYLFHLFQSGQFQNELAKITSNTGQTKYNKTNLKKIRIPIPPQEIQEKIVQILDKFTDYVTELTSELTSRKKQYSFYRDKLLSFEDEVYQVEWKVLKDVATLKNGKDWKTLPSGEIPVYGSGGEMGEFVADHSYDKPTVLIPRKGSISNLFYLEKAFWNVDTVYYTEIDDEQIIPKYFYYYLTTVKLEEMATNPTRPSLTQAILDKIRIPVPSLEIQSRIVQVLDNFDKVCNDLNIGLPRENELRQKQYEYFREKLLTFVAEGEYTESRVEEWDNSAIIKLLQWVFGPIRVEFGAMAKIVRGASPRPISKFITESEKGIPWIKIGEVEKDSKYVSKTKERITQAGSEKSRLVYKGDFIMSNSMSFGRPYILDIDGCIHDGWLSISSFEDLCSPDYLYHYLLTDTMQHMMRKNASNGTVQNLNAEIVRQLIIVLPPLSQQSQAVSVLDNFDTLTNSLSEGLPKEIELRQKQYEYWREQLFKF